MATPPLPGCRNDLGTEREVLVGVVVARAVGVAAGTTQNVTVEILASRAAAVGGQPGVLDPGTGNLLDAAIGIDAVHVPDQVRMLVIVVGSEDSAEFSMPGNPGCPQRAAGAQRPLAGYAHRRRACVDIVLQGRTRRKDDVAASARPGHATGPHPGHRNVLHEQIGLVDDARRLTCHLFAVVVRGRRRAQRILDATAALSGHLGKDFHVADGCVGHFRMAAASRQLGRNAHVRRVDSQHAIVADQLVHQFVDVEPDLAIATDHVEIQRIPGIRTQAEIHQRNRAAIVQLKHVAAPRLQ